MTDSKACPCADGRKEARFVFDLLHLLLLKPVFVDKHFLLFRKGERRRGRPTDHCGPCGDGGGGLDEGGRPRDWPHRVPRF